MHTTLKLMPVGTSIGAIFPAQLLKNMKAKKGDKLFVTETPSGYLLTAYDPEVDEQVKMGLEIMDEYRDTLRALAK